MKRYWLSYNTINVKFEIFYLFTFLEVSILKWEANFVSHESWHCPLGFWFFQIQAFKHLGPSRFALAQLGLRCQWLRSLLYGSLFTLLNKVIWVKLITHSCTSKKKKKKLHTCVPHKCLITLKSDKKKKGKIKRKDRCLLSIMSLEIIYIQLVHCNKDVIQYKQWQINFLLASKLYKHSGNQV